MFQQVGREHERECGQQNLSKNRAQLMLSSASNCRSQPSDSRQNSLPLTIF